MLLSIDIITMEKVKSICNVGESRNFTENDPFLQIQLYINNGKGGFTLVPLPTHQYTNQYGLLYGECQ